MAGKQGFATVALHTTVPKSEFDLSISVSPVITPASTYVIPPEYHLGEHTRMVYGRYGHASRNAMEATLGKMEGGEFPAITFASGMAAINAVATALLKQGDHIVAAKQMYGGTYNFFTQDLPRFGITCTMVDKNDVESVKKALTPKTRLVWLEVCSNPLQEITDLKSVSEAIKGYSKDIYFGVDNTYLTPYIVKPLFLGVDIVMHSCSKFLGGHNDLIMGSIQTDRKEVNDEVRRVQRQLGAVPSSFDCFLMHRSLSTVEVRMLRHHENSLKLARYLSKHPGVSKVVHPLLPEHPSHELAVTQHNGLHSGMLSVYVKGGEKAAMTFLHEIKVVLSAVSLGGVASLASYPPKLSHSYLTQEDRDAMKINEGLVRLSIGLETPEDIMRDIDQALVKATGLGPLKI